MISALDQLLTYSIQNDQDYSPAAVAFVASEVQSKQEFT